MSAVARSKSLGLPGTISATGYTPPENLPFDEWQRVGAVLRQIESGVLWWIGDWLRFGERKYGERYSQALETTEYEYQTLRNTKWVAERFSELSRRRDNLSFSHHAEVADLKPKEQDRFLGKAESEGWTRNQLRQELKEWKRDQREIEPGDMPDGDGRFRLMVADVADVPVANGEVDCIITDPPYGAEHLGCYDALAVTARRVLKSGGSCLVMTGQSYLPAVIDALARELTYHWTLAYLTPGGQAPQVWDRKVNAFWKPILWFVKGAYDGPWVGDVAKSDDNDKRFHEWGQSESGMADLVRRVTSAGERVFDPFLGAGTTGVVSVALGRRFVGSDIDADAIERSTPRLRLAARTVANGAAG